MEEERWIFKRQKKTLFSLFRALSYRSFVLFSFSSSGNQQFQDNTFLELSKILTSTSDQRQDGNRPPFTTSSPQKDTELGNVWLLFVEDRGALSRGAWAPISAAVDLLESEKITLACFDRRPIQNRPREETNLRSLQQL